MEGRAPWVLFLFLSGCRQLVGIEDRQVPATAASGREVESCGLPSPSADCAACVAAECCDEAQACADDQQCAETERCSEACASGDAACRLGCSGEWEPAEDVRQALTLCRNEFCIERCQPWSCLGNVAWQIPDGFPSARITATTTCACNAVIPGGKGEPNAGVEVRVCSTADPECRAELVAGVSDEEGRVQLTLPTGGIPQAVYLEFHKPGWLDTLLMLNTPPLSYDFDVGEVRMDQPDDIREIDLGVTYEPTLAVAKLRVSDCNLQPSTGISLDWADRGEAVIETYQGRDWDAFAMNLPVPANGITRVTARLPPAPETGPLIAVAYLVVRKGTITLAPFVTPTP